MFLMTFLDLQIMNKMVFKFLEYLKKLRKYCPSKNCHLADFDLEAGTLNAARAGPRGHSDLKFWEFWFLLKVN